MSASSARACILVTWRDGQEDGLTQCQETRAEGISPLKAISTGLIAVVDADATVAAVCGEACSLRLMERPPLGHRRHRLGFEIAAGDVLTHAQKEKETN